MNKGYLVIKQYNDGNMLYANRQGYNIAKKPTATSGGYGDITIICKIKGKELPTMQEVSRALLVQVCID